MRTTKALIIGFGSIGKKHFEALKDLCQISIISSQKLDLKGVKVYESLEKAPLKDFDYFIIANITSAHFETLKYLNSRLKDKIILVEKPLFKHYKNLNLQNEVYVAYLLRFNPILKTLKKLIKPLNIYNVSIVCKSYLPFWREMDYKKSYSASKKQGGGVLLDLSHELDYAFWLFGSLKLLYAKSARLSELEISSDDFAFLCFEGKKKAFLSVELDYFSKFSQRQILIDAREVSMKADLNANFIEIYDQDKSMQRLDFQADTLSTLKALHKGVLKKSKQVTSFKEAQKILKLIDKIKKEYA